MLKRILISLVISVLSFCLIVYLSYNFLMWLSPPVKIIDGEVRVFMPLGAVFYSLIFGIIVAVVGFVVSFRKVKKQK
ncbi:hypothetical protein CAPN002_09460 [Capnocytophaga stomatis]|nr:hypothetical protein CAPN002_09460 [Capnocytophaga stomatis]GIM48561.1 hypothetical protein CAPN003_00130 [Capnocytophaga stomatis]